MHYHTFPLGIKLSAPEGIRFKHHFCPHLQQASENQNDGNPQKEATGEGPMTKEGTAPASP